MMQRDVLELIEFWKEKHNENQEYCEELSFNSLQDVLWHIINAVMACGYHSKGITSMENSENFNHDKIEAIRASCNEQGVVIIKTGTEIDDQFIPYIEGQYGYLYIKIENKECYVDTTLYSLNKSEFVLSDWLEFIINYFIYDYNLFPEADEEYPMVECYVTYLCDRLQEEHKRRFILENEGEEALKAYDERKTKAKEPFDNKQFIMDQFDNPPTEWFGCDFDDETREELSSIYPEGYKEWLSKQPALKENQIKFYDIIKAIKGKDEEGNPKAAIILALDDIKVLENKEIDIITIKEFKLENVIVDRIGNYPEEYSINLLFDSEENETFKETLNILKELHSMNKENETFGLTLSLEIIPLGLEKTVVSCTSLYSCHRYGKGDTYSGLSFSCSREDFCPLVPEGIEIVE